MPSVKILRNIGTVDCATLSIDPNAAKEGATLDCSQEVADELVRCCLAEVEEKPVQQHEAKHQRQQPRQ